MIKFIYSQCFSVLKQKPIKLWGLSLLGTLLIALSTALGILPIIYIPIVLTLEAGMSMVYLNGYDRKEVASEDIFKGFSDFKHVAAGMAWMSLWIFLWALIPVVGVIFAIIKTYQYRFTPYILMTEPEIAPTMALKESMKRTEGHKGHMFWADMLFGLGVFVVVLVLMLLSQIRYIGILFTIIMVLFNLIVTALSPIFYGLLSAAFYREAPNMPVKPKYAAPVQPQYDPNQQQYNNQQANAQNNFCPQCGAPNAPGAKFCAGCGCKLQ